MDSFFILAKILQIDIKIWPKNKWTHLRRCREKKYHMTINPNRNKKRIPKRNPKRNKKRIPKQNPKQNPKRLIKIKKTVSQEGIRQALSQEGIRQALSQEGIRQALSQEAIRKRKQKKLSTLIWRIP